MVGIGAGDYPVEFTAWTVPYAESAQRLGLLEESVAAIREIWQGKLVTFEGQHVRLKNAACTPVPSPAPRVVIGAGSSKRLVDRAVNFADEINVYGDREIVEYAHEKIAETGRATSVSVFGHRPDGQLPADLAGEIRQWRDLGATRYFMTVGFDDDIVDAVDQIAAAKRAVVNG